MVEPLVTVEQGQLRGKTGVDYNGKTYFSFQGIPYAKPPVGELRFKAPEAPEQWTGIRDATKEGNQCYSRHYEKRFIVGSEDCLFLNVYTPQLPDETVSFKPVMVWIHGGSFSTGSGNSEFFGPEFLITRDVVVITINYRLGALGFLSLEDTTLGVPGNAGFKDMVMALKWVQKNINKFCGDPQNVTIFGQSAGGAAVHLLMLSPMSEGLFHRIIGHSGCALDSWCKGRRYAKELAQSLGSSSTNDKEILQFLREQPIDKLFDAQENFKANGVVLEKSSDEPAFLTEEPIDLYVSGRYHKVPVLAGYTSREGMVFESIRRFADMKIISDFETVIPSSLKISRGSELSLELAQKFKEFYFGEEEPTEKNIDKYYVLLTDVHFLRGLFVTLKHICATSSAPSYLYRFSLDTNLNVCKKISGVKVSTGAAHSDDYYYLFNSALTPKIYPNSIEDISIKRMTKLWTNFARHGNPNPSHEDPLINVKWNTVEKKILHFLDIGENLTAGSNPEFHRIKFMNEVVNTKPELTQWKVDYE